MDFITEDIDLLAVLGRCILYGFIGYCIGWVLDELER